MLTGILFQSFTPKNLIDFWVRFALNKGR